MAPLKIKDKINAFAEEKEIKQKLIDYGDTAVQKLLKGIASKISDNTIPYLNSYDNAGFLEGSGYFLSEPKENSAWSVGFAKESIIPERVQGNLYLAGYLSFPPNKACGVISEQMIRAFAFDDGSGRGINVFAVIDCVGISNYDIRVIRNRLHDLIEEKNIVSINISSTHCHSGADTQGVWGDLIDAVKKNPKAVKKENTLKNAVSGRNPDFMEYLFVTAADVITRAVNGMEKGKLSYALLPCEQFVRDKRPPYITDTVMTVLRFEPQNSDSKKLLAVFLAAHPTNYGPKQRVISADFPYYICDELQNAGYEAAYFQGAEAAVATDRGKFCEPGDSRHGGIAHYGRAIAKYILAADENEFKPVEPMLNVIVNETFIPVDNGLMELLGKIKLVSNNVVKVQNGDDNRNYDFYFSTEIGIAEFGRDLKLALIPGELIPEIAYGGAYGEEESYKKTGWSFPAFKDVVNGHLTVIGLCNDAIGYIIPDNDFGSVFAPLHYEEAISAGGRTGSNIAGAFIRTAEAAEKIRIK
ncbi:MAG: hypothetical protein J1E34_06785 [Oscillospiraceae bacterium]|nr:hypothetical protein [Oscillospiraceae bacterium]